MAINAVLSNRSSDVDVDPVFGGVARRSVSGESAVDRSALLDPLLFLPLLALAIGLGALLSALGVFSEVYTYRRFEDSWEILVMLTYGIAEAFFYRPWKAFVSWQALFEYIRGDRQWGEMTRTKFDQ